MLNIGFLVLTLLSMHTFGSITLQKNDTILQFVTEDYYYSHYQPYNFSSILVPLKFQFVDEACNISVDVENIKSSEFIILADWFKAADYCGFLTYYEVSVMKTNMWENEKVSQSVKKISSSNTCIEGD